MLDKMISSVGMNMSFMFEYIRLLQCSAVNHCMQFL